MTYAPNETGLTLRSAERQARKVRAFWAGHGMRVDAKAVRKPYGYVVRSSMVNGLPRRVG